MDLSRTLGFNRPEKSTALLDRLQKFMPEIATANANLSKTTESDIKIIAIEDDSDASSSTDSDEEPQTKTKQPQVIMDVTTVREDARTQMVLNGSDCDVDDDEEQQSLPIGFRTRKPMQKKKRQILIEEVVKEHGTGKDISND